MEKRQKAILTATVDEYIRSGEPVGSKALATVGNLNVSSATIRSQLSTLEEAGFVSRVHTSSGRVPTDKGYRFYVDSLMKMKKTSGSANLDLTSAVGNLTDDVSAVLERTADVLSSLIDYTTIVLTPEIYQEALRVVQFISLDVNRVLIILLNGVGINSEMVLNILHDGDQEDLNRISKYMSKKLEGCPATAFNESVIDESIRALPEYESILMQVRVAIGKLKTRKDQDQKMLLKGVSKMLKLPEFQNIAYTQKVMATLEENKILLHLLKNVADKNEGRVIIGKENEIPELNDCSLVLAPYTVKEKSTGVVGILGPTRMAYSVIIPIVKRVSELINNVGNRDKEDQT